MQFRVPQFIDIEDKIIGPLTWRQFAYCLGAVGVTYLAMRFVSNNILALIVAAPFAGLFLALAFVKINNQPFVEVLEHAVNYFTKSNIYTWQKRGDQMQTITPETDSLKQKSLNLDTKNVESENE
jgi:hypothetical protein